MDFGAVLNQSGGACGAARAALVQLTLIVQLVKHGEPRCCLERSAALPARPESSRCLEARRLHLLTALLSSTVPLRRRSSPQKSVTRWRNRASS